MIKYSPSIIKEYADRLYTEADIIVAAYTVIGAAIGAGPGYFFAGGGGFYIAGAVLGVLGFLIGRAKAFDLRLRAQTALCQVKIEENTRLAGSGKQPTADVHGEGNGQPYTQPSTEKRRKSVFVDPDTVKVGDRVKHSALGMGKVTAIEGDAVRVEFENGKSYAMTPAALQTVAEQ